MSTRRWLRMSWWNAALTAAALLTAVIFATRAQWFVAIAFAVIATAVAGSAIYARSGRASDFTRLNAAEYLDERDRTIGVHALAIVGVCAMLIAMGVLVAAMLLLEPGDPMSFIAWAQVVLLTIAWAVANVVAVRRS
ncbi:hypothetical protein AA0Z99_01160 [Agrococcus sp. 1P02AA]|uniref:hypothetical protein n=1 Tax=Agrococcus sp. 1P02AA TaxID=3132259 RepID=UPI0039A5A0E8